MCQTTVVAVLIALSTLVTSSRSVSIRVVSDARMELEMHQRVQDLIGVEIRGGRRWIGRVHECRRREFDLIGPAGRETLRFDGVIALLDPQTGERIVLIQPPKLTPTGKVIIGAVAAIGATALYCTTQRFCFGR